MNKDKIIGSILGLALGDAYGAPFEGGVLERLLWKMIGKSNGTFRWTDDTQMTLDLLESLISCGKVNQDDLAMRFAASYQWSRGYGPGAAKLLKRIRRGESWETANKKVFRDGSFGNGGAMRSPVIGLYFADKPVEELIQAAIDSAVITHAHPLGIEGAVIIALATSLAYKDYEPHEIVNFLCNRNTSKEYISKLDIASNWLQLSSPVEPKEAASVLGNKSSALNSCVTSIYAALSHYDKPFEDLLQYVIKIRGDVDTIAAMSCVIWGAHQGINNLPKEKINQLEQQNEILTVATSFAHVLIHKKEVD